MKVRTKLVVVEAEQFLPGQKPWPRGVWERPPLYPADHVYFFGLTRVNPGDWIINGVNGVEGPCKPDIFEQTYEILEDK